MSVSKYKSKRINVIRVEKDDKKRSSTQNMGAQTQQRRKEEKRGHDNTQRKQISSYGRGEKRRARDLIGKQSSAINRGRGQTEENKR